MNVTVLESFESFESCMNVTFSETLECCCMNVTVFLRVWRKFESWNLNVTFSKTVDCHCMNVTLSEMFEWFCMNVSVFGGWWGLLRDVDQLAQFVRFGSSSVAWNELKKIILVPDERRVVERDTAHQYRGIGFAIFSIIGNMLMIYQRLYRNVKVICYISLSFVTMIFYVSNVPSHYTQQERQLWLGAGVFVHRLLLSACLSLFFQLLNISFFWGKT